MKTQRETSLRIRLAGLAIIGLFIALAAAAYFSGRQVQRSSELITTDAVPGMIASHDMRMAMSRAVGWEIVAASAQTTQSRDANIKIAHDADAAFANAVTQYKATIKINPAEDNALLEQVTNRYAEYYQQRMAYEALILAGNRDGSAAFLETNLVPAYVAAIQSAEDLIKYNNGNSTTYAKYIRNSVQRLYLAVAVVMVLALVCAAVLVVNFAIRRREVMELRASEVRFRMLIENAPLAINISRDGKSIYANQKFLDYYGYQTVEELVGRSILIFWAQEFREIIKERVQKRARGEPIPSDYEGMAQRKDGSHFPVQIVVASVELPDGPASMAFINDITERKQVDQAVRESEEKFAKAFQSSPSGITISELATGRIIEVNESYCRIQGYSSPQEMIGRTSVEVGVFSSAEERQRAFQPLLDGGTLRDSEVQIRTRDGSHRTILFNAELIELGGKQCIVSLAQDITERKRSQDELVWKTALLEAQVDSTLDGILVVDTMGKKILQNQRFLELLKVPDEIARDDDDAKMFQHAVNQMKNPQQFRERVIYLYGNPDEIGREEIELADGRFFDRYSAPVRDKAGKRFGRIWTFRDITDQKKLEQQFRQSQKMEAVGQLASGVAHDFNNILGVIQMQSDLLKADGTLSPAQTGFASEIGEAVERAAALTRQLLLFGRKEKMQARELDLNQSINDMTKMLRRTLGGNIELQFKFSMQPLFVNADAGMMDQVLMNLAVNARDAMPKGGKIVIEASAVMFDESIKDQYVQASAGSFVCLSVSDTGSGIPPEILPKIFEPFFTTKDVGKGTGLGLATVFGIVQQHKGWINVYSEIGQGTAFRIYIPRLARISDQKFVAPLAEPASGGNETILVVEDEPKLRASVINILSRLGYNVLEASDGASALEAWKKHRNEVHFAMKLYNQHRDEIHLLLTDMVMPGGMTGKDLGERLLKEDPKLKVIYASGYSTEVAAKDFPLEEGVNFLSKPFQAQKLAQTIRNILDGGLTLKT